MAEIEAWIGDCHLRNAAGQELAGRAAVWANNYDHFRALLQAHLAPQGLSILWLEEVLPASQYLARYPGQATPVGRLAQTVHDLHWVELGPLAGLDVQGRAEEPESYLKIEEIKGVEPLDAQFGVWEKKTVPDALYEPIFGQHAPTEAEIAEYGSAGAVPPMKTYAILDAAKVPLLPLLLESSGLAYRCLFKGEAEEELRDVAPYLVKLEESSSFTRNLFTKGEAGWQLWDNQAGIFLRSALDLSSLQRHFRKFTRAVDRKGRWHYLRFYDPACIIDYVSSLGPEKFFKFTAGISSMIVARPWRSTVIKIYPNN